MTMASPWMTSGYTFDRQPKSPDRPILFKCLDPILRTGWCITTLRTNPWRNDALIDHDQKYEWPAKQATDPLHRKVIVTGLPKSSF